jgi:hypothetical protein
MSKEKRKRMLHIFKTIIKDGVEELSDIDLIGADIYAREMLLKIQGEYHKRSKKEESGK